MKQEAAVVEQAKQVAATVESWADLCNALYNAFDGILTRAFPTRAEREAFIKTKEYKQIQDLIHEAQDKFGFVEGSIPKKSGKFVVRVPRSLHAALEHEASCEGVSMNQLITTKLAVPLSRLAKPQKRKVQKRRAG
jgi:predicted HicB family RNase H-like nuclease